MSCENLLVPKPVTVQCPTSIFGIPLVQSGRTVASTPYEIQGIVLHCYPGTIDQLCNELKCKTKGSIITGSLHNSYHYGVGISGHGMQFVQDNDVSWAFGAYTKNTYAATPPPNEAINWPVLQAVNGENVTPDVYVLNVAITLGTNIDTTTGCFVCPTTSGLPIHQHDELIQLLAFLAQEYSIPIDVDHIEFHDHITCDAETFECPCTEIDDLLSEVASYCPPCADNAEMPAVPVAQVGDIITHVLGSTEACCPDSVGCMVQVPFDACWIGDLAIDGDLTDFILGLSENVEGQMCLTRGCIGVSAPITGCGTTADPLGLDLCAWGDYIPTQVAGNVVNVVGLDATGCLINAPFGDLVTENETPITVVDTNCINLTASGVSNHTLQADVIVSPCVGNLLTCEPDGLCVQIECADFTGLFVAGTIVNLYGNDGAGACIVQSVADVVNDAICLIPENLALVPTGILARDAVTCPVYVTPNQVVAAGLTVLDTDCIDLTWAGNVLSAVPIIDPAADNMLDCGIDGLYVPQMTVNSSNSCINLTLAGNQLSTDVVISPNIGNQITCETNGLFVPASVEITVQNGACVGLTLVGGLLTPEAIISPVAGNQVECSLQGLYVPKGAGLEVLDTPCLDLSIVAGVISGVITFAPTQAGVLNIAQCLASGLYVPQAAITDVLTGSCVDLTVDPTGVLSAEAVIDPQVGNQISCNLNGLFVPLGAGLAVDDTDCIDLDLVAGVLTGVIALAGPQGGVPNIANCIPGQGFYVPETAGLSVLDTSCVNLTMTSGVLTADIIISPAADNQVQCVGGGLYVPATAGLIVLDTDCIALNLAGDTLTATPVIAPAQGGIDNGLVCIPGQGMYVANNVSGVDVFNIADLFVGLQVVVGGDTIIFQGINGATQIVTAPDTVTIDGHMICAAGPPIAIPPYDIDQAWTNYDPNSSIKYEWNCATNKWETCGHELAASLPPTGATCAVNTIINGVTDGVWCPGTSIYRIPANVGQAQVDRSYQLLEDCEWAKIEGSGSNLMVLAAPMVGIAEGLAHLVLYDTSGVNDLGINDIPNNGMTVEEAGCYTVETNIVVEILGDGYKGVILRSELRVNGIGVEHVAEAGGWTQDNALSPANPVTTPLSGSQTVCLQAGDLVQIFYSLDAEGAVGNYDIALASLRMTLIV